MMGMAVIQQPCTGVGVCFLKRAQMWSLLLRVLEMTLLQIRGWRRACGKTPADPLSCHSPCVLLRLFTGWPHALHAATALSMAGEGGWGVDFSLHCASSSMGFRSILILYGQLPLVHLVCELPLEQNMELCLWHPLAPTQRKHSSRITAAYGREDHASRMLK